MGAIKTKSPARDAIQTKKRLDLEVNRKPDRSLDDDYDLQRQTGNQASIRLSDGTILQPKLTISQPDDPLEKEADRIADQVMRMPEPKINENKMMPTEDPTGVQRLCEECEDDLIQPKKKPRSQLVGDERLDQDIQTFKTGGQPLSEGARSFFEPRFGVNLNDIRIHTTNKANQTAEEINAQAFTLGRNIVFNRGKFTPESQSGKHLIAHELTHAIQQNRNSSSRKITNKGVYPNDNRTKSLRPKPQDLVQRLKNPNEEVNNPIPLIETEPESFEVKNELATNELCRTLVNQPMIVESQKNSSDNIFFKLGGDNKKPRGGKIPNLNFRFWLIKNILPWYWGSKGKARFQCDFPFANKERKSRPIKKHRRTKKRNILDWFKCITEYEINRTTIVDQQQPTVTDRLVDNNYTLNDNSAYTVQWDMRSIPDRVIITDNTNENLILDTGMISGIGQQNIQGPANIHIRVIPNDGTNNPKNTPTSYNYQIIKTSNDVVKEVTCYLFGVIPIGRKIGNIMFNPNFNYRSRTKRKMSFLEARRLLS